MTDAFVSRVCAAAARAVDDYLEMSGCDDQRAIPESWIQCSIARDLRAQTSKPSVLLEVPTDPSRWSSKRPNPLAGRDVGRKGRIDMLVFDRLEGEDHDEVWCAIEVKGAMSGWPAFTADMARLTDLVTSTEIRFGLLVYVSCRMPAAEMKKDRTTFRATVGATAEEQIVRETETGELWRVATAFVGV